MSCPRVEWLEDRRLFSAVAGLLSAWEIGSPEHKQIAGQATDASGNVYVAGKFEGTVDFNLSPTKVVNLTASDVDGDAFVAKYESTGKLRWVRRIGGAGADVTIYSVAYDAANARLILGGSFGGAVDLGKTSPTDAGTAFAITSSGGQDGFLARLDAGTGATQWIGRLKGTFEDHVTRVAVDGGGNVYAGGSHLQHNGATAYSLGFVAKFAANGKFAWEKALGDAFGGTEITALELTAAGEAYVAGERATLANFNPETQGPFDFYVSGSFLTRLTAGGREVWTSPFGVGGVFGAPGGLIKGIALDGKGNFVAVGHFSQPINLNLGWGGPKISMSQWGFSDVFVAKYTTDRRLLWAKQIGVEHTGDDDEVSGDEHANAVEFDAAGNVLVAGGWYNVAFFNPGVSNVHLSGDRGGFLAKYKPDGTFITVWDLGKDSEVAFLDRGAGGVMLASGSYFRPFDADPGPGVLNLAWLGNDFANADLFVLRLK
jgi:hypothetical protein